MDEMGGLATMRVADDPTLTEGNARPLGDYNLWELRCLKGPPLLCDMVWTGSRWSVTLQWAEVFPREDGIGDEPGPILRTRHRVVEAPGPDWDACEPGYRPRGTPLISLRCCEGVLAGVRALGVESGAWLSARLIESVEGLS